MNSQVKLGLSAYALLYAATALIGFRFGDALPVATIYVLLGVLFAVPVWLGVRANLTVSMKVALLLTLPLLPALLVVDPLEVGFYGYDPYRTLQTTFEFRANGPAWIANNRASWPAFYSLVWAVTSLTGVEVATVGRYLPLFVVGVPVVFYAFARGVVSDQTAFLAALGFAGVRTLFTFQTKFVDESLAFAAFFLLLLALRLGDAGGSRSRWLSYLFALTAVLSHHFVGLLTVAVLVLWDVTRLLASVRRSGHRSGTPLSGVTALAGGVFGGMFLLVAPDFVVRLFGLVELPSFGPTDGGSTDAPSTSTATDTTSVSTDSGGTTGLTESSPQGATTIADTPEAQSSPTTDDGAPTGMAGRLVGFLTDNWRFLPANALLVGLASVVAAGLPSLSFQRNRWPLVATILGGLLAVGYGFSIVFGPIVPLDPSRYPVYMVPMLLLALAHLVDAGRIPTRRQALAVAVVLLAVTQLLLVAPGVLYTDISGTTVEEDHYSPAQLAASDHVARYGVDQVVGWERGLWVRAGAYAVPREEAPDCGILRVWRRDAPTNYFSPTDEVVYDNGAVRLYDCGVG
jgi:hypothetical protein